MAFISEVYCKICKLKNPAPFRTPVSMICPMSGIECDGGGNRHQTTIKCSSRPEIKAIFGEQTEKVVPAVCSITYTIDNAKESRWIVCPRKLFSSSFNNLNLNANIQKHELSILQSSGLPIGTELGIWGEVYLKDSGNEDGDDYTVNYHFDYLVCPLVSKTVKEIADEYRMDIEQVVSEAKRGGFLRGRVNQDSLIERCPELSMPIILEIMTASTSGSDTERGTNISSAFLNAIQGKPCPSPGINRRQVWGRMATQLFAKSCLAEKWGGKTIWIIQDQLMNEISRATGLKLSALEKSSSNPNINIAVLSFLDDEQTTVALRGIHEWDCGIDLNGAGTMIDILLPSSYPGKDILMKSLLRRGLSSIVNI